MRNPKSNLNNSGFVAVFIVFLIVIVGAVSAYIYFKKSGTTIPLVQNIITKTTEDTSSWKTYTNTEAGFSFKYPPSVLFDSKAENSATQSELLVSAEKLSDIPEDLPSFMGRNDAMASKELLAKGENKDFVKIGSLNGTFGMRLSQFEICSIILSRTLTFFPGEYRVIITLAGPQDAIMNSMPEFFTVDEKNCGSNRMWNQENKSSFSDTLKQGKGKGAAQEWYDNFDAIVKTLKLVEPVITPSPVPTATISSDLLTYKNFVYGFEISYPKSFKAQTSKEDLYGYPKGILLLYSGGQAYDVIVEVWNTKAEYEKEYAGRLSDLTVFESKGKFITVLDNTKTAETKEIIKNFKLTE